MTSLDSKSLVRSENSLNVKSARKYTCSVCALILVILSKKIHHE